MTWLLTGVGAVLLLVVMWDVFHTIWHPRGFGGVARLVFRLVWRVLRPLSRGDRSNEVVGPVGLLLAVLTWSLLTVVGWALLYWPRMPEGFHFGSSLDPERSSGPLDALYLSLVAVSTLGLGDITPASEGLRLLVPLEAISGFVLLTAAISWVLQLYPALARRRALARRLDALQSSDAAAVVREGDPSIASGLLDGVSAGVVDVAFDFEQYAESYYFREENPRQALAARAPVLLELVAAGEAHRAPEVRQAAAALSSVVDELAETLDRQYLATGQEPREVFRAMREDHQH